MSFYYKSGRLITTASNWRPQYGGIFDTPASDINVTSDNIRPVTLYVESQHDIPNGHIAEWTGEPRYFDNRGNRIDAFASSEGHHYALSSVRPSGTHSKTVAGVVINKAASPDDKTFTHKGAIHSVHSLPDDVAHIYRVGRDIALAWVIDSHHGELEGLYKKYVNGVEDQSGLYQLTMTGRDIFTIEPTITAQVETQLADLTARFNSLVAPDADTS